MSTHHTKAERRPPHSSAQFWAVNAPRLIKKYGWGISDSYRARLQKIADEAEFELRSQSDRIGIANHYQNGL